MLGVSPFRRFLTLISPLRSRSGITLQTSIREKPMPEADYQIQKNPSIDKCWTTPTRTLKKAQRNYPQRHQLFWDGNEANVSLLPTHIEPFILPLVKLEVNYCSHNKDSDALREYLSEHMVSYAKEHPSVEFLIKPRFSKPPQAIATYNTGRVETISLKKKNLQEIHEALMDARNGSGLEPKKFHIGVSSHAPAIRNLWDPWHGANLSPFDGSEQTWKRTLKSIHVKWTRQRTSEKAALWRKFSTYHETSKRQWNSRSHHYA